MSRTKYFSGAFALTCILFWSGISLIGRVQAQTVAVPSDSHCHNNTLAQIAQHTETAYANMRMTRGFTPRVDLNRNTSGAIEHLSGLSMKIDAKLLIFTREADLVCGYLVDFTKKSPLVEASYSLGSMSELTQLVSDSRFAFGVYQAQVTRAPQRSRGASAMAQHEPMAGVSEKAFRELGIRLFPVGVISRLYPQVNLMVLPTGVLATLPFSALIPEQATDPLSERVVLSILPALSADRDKSGGAYIVWQGTSGDRALVLGNPDLTRHEDWKFQPLPGAELEARSVAATLPGWAYFGREATADHFFNHADQADLIYLATHAVSSVSSDREALDESFIALSDRLITPREIQHSNFKASLAVLSACQTGLGAPHDGGTIGLARAFNLAGVPGVIMSLWNVDDMATKALMASFMRHLESKAPQEALSLAMRERRRVDPNPAKWASFMYFGFPMLSKESR